jgi:hypothetical protein
MLEAQATQVQELSEDSMAAEMPVAVAGTKALAVAQQTFVPQLQSVIV